MKFSSKEDVEAPIDEVFAMLSEFETFERSALRRGADVRRLDALSVPGVGMCWEARFRMRGKPRQMQITLTEFDRPNSMVFESVAPGFKGNMILDLMPLSRNRTRISVSMEARPQNLSARLMVQSLKLAKRNLNKRFKLRVADYAKELEDRYKSVA